MELLIENQRRTLEPLGTFRRQWGLPESFGVAYFEPKEWDGLGTMDGSREALATLQARVVAAVPALVKASDLLREVERLTALFHREFDEANAQVGLRDVEVEYAVAGFENVLQSVASHLVLLAYTHHADPEQIREAFDFSALYHNWLDGTARVSFTVHPYEHGNHRFEVRMLNDAYGRVGMEVRVADEVHYVLDTSLACPAARYMKTLCETVAQPLCEALIRGLLA
ncbi:MAG: hypothetical protein H0T73_07960 [Ardenticatenales bacterium]|nr:hypothetical protein [Ardenticatenales bacterium]